MRCNSCDSEKHILSKCPHSWENMEIFDEEGITGNNESVAGIQWMYAYIQALRDAGRKEVIRDQYKIKPRFKVGGGSASKSRCTEMFEGLIAQESEEDEYDEEETGEDG